MKLRAILESDYEGLDTEDSFGEEVLGVGDVTIQMSILDLLDAVLDVTEILGNEPEYAEVGHLLTYSWSNVALTQSMIDRINDATVRVSDPLRSGKRTNVKWNWDPH